MASSRPSCSQRARPIPDAPPVMIATFCVVLLVTQGVDGIDVGGFEGRVAAENDSHY